MEELLKSLLEVKALNLNHFGEPINKKIDKIVSKLIKKYSANGNPKTP